MKGKGGMSSTLPFSPVWTNICYDDWKKIKKIKKKRCLSVLPPFDSDRRLTFLSVLGRSNRLLHNWQLSFGSSADRPLSLFKRVLASVSFLSHLASCSLLEVRSGEEGPKGKKRGLWPFGSLGGAEVREYYDTRTRWSR